MRLLFWMLAISLVAAGCDFTSKNNKQPADDYQDLVTIQEPVDDAQSSKIYIDSVQIVTTNNKTALLISGTFPDACTKLGSASHRREGDTLYLDITAWRNPQTMCAQVLTPYSFLYKELTSNALSANEQIIINGTAYSYQP